MFSGAGEGETRRRRDSALPPYLLDLICLRLMLSFQFHFSKPSRTLLLLLKAKSFSIAQLPFCRTGSTQTPLEQSSHRASLMAGGISLGPSDAPCPVESSTAHDESIFWVVIQWLSNMISTTSLVIFLTQHIRKPRSAPKIEKRLALNYWTPTTASFSHLNAESIESKRISLLNLEICLSSSSISMESRSIAVLVECLPHRFSQTATLTPPRSLTRFVTLSKKPSTLKLISWRTVTLPELVKKMASDALCLVSSSTAHGGTLIGLVVSLNGPLKQKTSPFPYLINSSPNSYGPSISTWPRFVYIKLWPFPIFLRFRYSNVKGRRHFSVFVSTSLSWLSHSDSQIMVLLISSCLGLAYYCRIDYVLQCTIPVHTFSLLKEIQSSIDLTCQIVIQPLHLYCLMRDPNHLLKEKPFDTSSFMERTLLWNLHPWPPMSKVKNCHCFLVFGSPVPVTPKAKVTSTTSQNLLIVTNLYFADLFAKAFSTHHDLACGKVLRCFCLRVPMNLSLNFEAYPPWFSTVILILFALVVSNHEVEELVTFSPFWV